MKEFIEVLIILVGMFLLLSGVTFFVIGHCVLGCLSFIGLGTYIWMMIRIYKDNQFKLFK